METSSAFKYFYHSVLVPHLESIEVSRKKVTRTLWAAIASGITGLFLSVYYVAGFQNLSPEHLSNKNFLIALLLLVGWFVLSVIVYKKVFGKKLMDIRHRFKKSVIAKIVDFVDPGLQYFENELITKKEYDESNLFPVNAHYYYGEDYLLGRDGKVSYKFSEVHSQYVMKDHRGRKLFWTIFHGLFFIADVHQSFKSETVVLPDTAHKLFGPLGDWVQKWNIFRDNAVKISYPDFDREFVVYGTDVAESAKLLSDNLVKRITDFRKKSGHKVYLSFIGSKVYLAISLTQDLFEPPVFGTMLNYEAIHENYKYLKLATGIIDDLGFRI